MVGDTSFELVTPSMSPKCSTTELIAPTIHQPTRFIKRRIRATYIVNTPMLQDLFAALFKTIENSCRTGNSGGQHLFNFRHQIFKVKRFGQHFGIFGCL